MKEIVLMFILTVLQNASFTLVSRARNSKSLLYHGLAAILSNGIWLLVIRNVVMNLDSFTLMATYLMGSVTGSVLMHWVAMRFLEKRKLILQPTGSIVADLSKSKVDKHKYNTSTIKKSPFEE